LVSHPTVYSTAPSAPPVSMQSTSAIVMHPNFDTDADTFTSIPITKVFTSKAPSTSIPNSWEPPQPNNASPIYPTSAVRWS
jgi:hypothetical protein